MPIDFEKIPAPPGSEIDIDLIPPPPKVGELGVGKATAPVLPFQYAPPTGMEKLGQTASLIMRALLTSPDVPQAPTYIQEESERQLAQRTPLRIGEPYPYSNIPKAALTAIPYFYPPAGLPAVAEQALMHPWQSAKGLGEMLLKTGKVVGGLGTSISPELTQEAKQILAKEPETPLFGLGITGAGLGAGLRAGKTAIKRIPKAAEAGIAEYTKERFRPELDPNIVAQKLMRGEEKLSKAEVEVAIEQTPEIVAEMKKIEVKEREGLIGKEVEVEKPAEAEIQPARVETPELTELPFAKPAETMAKPKQKVSTWDLAETGRPIELEVYRGTGETGERLGILKPERSKQIGREQLLGEGTYYAPSRRTASHYGKVQKSSIRLENPYVIDRGTWKGIKELDIEGIKAAGHDGIIIRTGRSGGYGKPYEDLRQVVVFPKAAKPKAELPSAKAAKEPWEMTREEFIGFYHETMKRQFGKEEPVGSTPPSVLHDEVVRNAHAEGKDLPLQVLKDYPDLAAKGEMPPAKGAKEPLKITKEEIDLDKKIAEENIKLQKELDYIGKPHAKITDKVSSVNPISWKEWLPKRAELKEKKGSVQHWVTSNEHYIVHNDNVYYRTGNWGNVLFDKLSAPEILPAKGEETTGEIPKVGVAAAKPQMEAPAIPALEAPKETKAPEVVRLTKEAIAQDRARLELEELPPTQREHFVGWLQEARESGLTEKADLIVGDVLKTSRSLGKIEEMALLDRRARLENEYETEMTTASDLAAKGETKASRLANLRAEAVMKNLENLTKAAKVGGTEAGRALVAKKGAMELEDYSLARVTRDVQAGKGRKLNETELGQIRELTDKHKKTESELKELEFKYQDAIKNQERLIAEKVAQALTRRESKKGKTEKIKEKLETERIQVEKRLKDLGFQLNDVSGITAEGSYLIGKLAVYYIKKGALNLDQVVTRVKDKIPGLTDMDVYQALNARDPARTNKIRSDVQKRIDLIKREGFLLEQINKATKGILERTERQPKPTTARISELQKQLAELRRHLYRTEMSGRRLAQALETINRLEDQLHNHYRLIRENRLAEIPEEMAPLVERIKDLRGDMRVEDTIADLKEQLRTGEFKIKPRIREKIVPKELEKKQIEVKILRRQMRQMVIEAQPMTPGRRFAEGVNLLRTLKATADVSGWLRQGLFLSASRPGKFAVTATKSVKALFSKYSAEQIDNAFRSADHHWLREASDLYLAPLEAGHRWTVREEMFQSNLARKIPGWRHVIGASERNMVTFLNLMRVAAFDEFLRKYPNATRAELKGWADWVNVASGRGDLGKLAGGGSLLGVVFFAPRFAVSRAQIPYQYLKNLKNPRVRKMIGRDLASVAGLGGTILGLASLAGYKVGLDPREADFGKIRVGNTRYDIWGGVQQPMRLVFRIGLAATDAMKLTGRDLTAQEKNFNPLDAFMRFASYKVGPLASVSNELLTGETVVGEKVTIPQIAARAVSPMLFEDIYDAFREDGFGQAIPAAVLGATGVTVSTYADSESRTRRDIRKALHDDNWEEALRLQESWNIDHPDRQISEEFLLKQ